MNKRIDFYSFSGTGNTKFIVDIITERLTKSGFEVNAYPIENGFQSKAEAEKIGFAFPANSQAISPFIWKFFNKLPQGNGTKVFVVITLNDGTYILKPLYSLLKSKGYVPESCCEISMPNNMLTAQANETDDQERLIKAMKRASDYADAIVSGRAAWKEEKKGSGFVSFLTRKLGLPMFFMRKMMKLETDPGKCTKCQLCVNQCPVGNITLPDIAHGNRCELCMRCASDCPQKAIRVVSKQKVEVRSAVKLKYHP